MNQSVNFLKSLPKEPHYLSAVWIGAIVLFLLVLLTGISIFSNSNVKQLNQKLVDIRSQKTQAEIAYEKIKQAYPLLASEKPLVERVTELEQLVNAKRAALAALSHKLLREPFSDYLQALAEITPAGLWLTSFELNQDKDLIRLKGYSLKPVNVSLFLQALQKAPVFSDVHFESFYVHKVEDKPYVEFEVGNVPVELPKEVKL